MPNKEGINMLQEALEMLEWNRMFESDADDDQKEEQDTDSGEDEDIQEPSEDDAIEVSEDDETPPDIDSDDEDDDTESDTDSILSDISEKVKLSKTEIEILESLIDSEVDAISDYTKALNETKNKFARKLYTEIINDESKHLSQLKYLKSMGTDSDYVPKDQEANDELAEILESLYEEL